jgi:hypothetical protein
MGKLPVFPSASDCKHGFAFPRRLAEFDRCVATCFRSLGKARTLDSHDSRLRRKLDPGARRAPMRHAGYQTEPSGAN